MSNPGFKWDLTISLGNVLTLVSFIGLAVAGWNSIDRRITKIEDMQPFIQTARDAQDARFQSSLNTLSVDVKDVKTALDKLSLSVQVQSAVSNATKK